MGPVESLGLLPCDVPLKTALSLLSIQEVGKYLLNVHVPQWTVKFMWRHSAPCHCAIPGT